jgi:hypothetical protein
MAGFEVELPAFGVEDVQKIRQAAILSLGRVAREHGGDVSLRNGDHGGLRALIELPA